MKLHAGPGLIGGGKTDKEVKFILDGDFSTAGKHNPDAVPEKAGADAPVRRLPVPGRHRPRRLHEAMGPTLWPKCKSPTATWVSRRAGCSSRRGKTALAF